jgi:Predicted transcriptional regulators
VFNLYSFGDLLKQARITAGFTQVELALEVGIAKSTLSLYESNKREPDVEMIKKISSTLDVDPNFLLGIEKKAPQQVSAAELEIIKKYSQLDLRGQQAVLDTLNREYSYIDNNSSVNNNALVEDMANTINKAADVTTINQISRIMKK